MRHNSKLVKKLLKEIEFYENLGFHKMADDLTNQLVRYSASFWDTAKEVGSGLWDSAEKIIGIQRAMSMFAGIPACEEFIKAAKGGSPITFQSEGDFRKRMQDEWQQNNPGKPLDANALKQINELVQTQNIVDNGKSILDADPVGYRKCLDAATEMGLGEEVEQIFGKNV
jgi:hypothetical protein